MFISLSILCIALIAATFAMSGPRRGAALAFGLAIVMPNWIVREVGAVLVDLRLVCAMTTIGCVALHPTTRFSYRPLLADFILIALVATQLVTELIFANPTATQVFDNAFQWIVPYVFGRIVWRSVDDVENLVPIVAVCCAVLGVWAAFESITRINPVQIAFGYAGSLQGQTDFRWGLKRADGPLMHPIFFGLHMVLLFPFALEAARRARAGIGPAWWRRLPWIAAGGAFFSMSRGPQLGLVATAALTAALLKPRWRLPILLPLGVFMAAVAASPNTAVDVLQRWSGETATSSIDIRGEYYPYTGTMHRLLQVRVYEEALWNAGWFGYGSAAMGTGTTRIPHVEEHLRQMFSSIDNHYLQFTLQNGFLGLTLFLAFCFCGIGYALSALRNHATGLPCASAGIAAALISLTVLVSSVWLSSDIRFTLVTIIGMTPGMCTARRAIADPAQAAPVGPSWRLVPGHPDWKSC